MTRVNRWNDPASPSKALWTDADELRRKKRHRVTFAVLGGVSLLVVVAVLSSVGGAPGPQRGGAAANPDAFFEEAMFKLSQADEFIAIDLGGEELVMRQMPDVDRDTPGQSGWKRRERLIGSVVLDDPSVEGKQYTIFKVPEIFGNPLFQTRGVQQGDTIYFFAKVDQFGMTDDKYLKKQMRVYRNVSLPTAFKLQIRDVVDERTLLAIGGLDGEVVEPRPMEIFRLTYKNELKGQKESFLKPDDARVNWEPSPDRQVLVKATADLNEWLEKAKPDVEWEQDELLTRALRDRSPGNQQITDVIRESVQQARLDQMSFDFDDARFIQEAAWLRDISRTARSESGDLAKAKKLFDWTVRHIQLEPEQIVRKGPRRFFWHRPWQTLLYGSGSATERAWVFMLLARQQNLNVVMLAHSDPEKPAQLKFWLPALVHKPQSEKSQSEKPRLYLFDTTLGLPIEGPRGDVATLSDVLADATLLDRLKLDGQPDYGTTSADLKRQVVAFIEASPRYFTKRMKLIEDKLSGRGSIKLSTHTVDLRKNLRDAGVEYVRLWHQPAFVHRAQKNLPRDVRRFAWAAFQIHAWVPSLWSARMLNFREFGKKSKGKSKVDARDAVYYYLRCLKPDIDLRIANIPAARSWLMQKLEWRKYAKMQSTYWLALVHFDNGRFSYAVDFLNNRWLKAYSNTPFPTWKRGAKYNLARSYEAQGELKKAIQLYRDDVGSPQRHGNLLRARRLESQLPPAPKDEPLPPNPDPKVLPPNPDPTPLPPNLDPDPKPPAAKTGG